MDALDTLLFRSYLVEDSDDEMQPGAAEAEHADEPQGLKRPKVEPDDENDDNDATQPGKRLKEKREPTRQDGTRVVVSSKPSCK